MTARRVRLALALLAVAAAAPVRASESAWEITIAARIRDAGDKPVEVHVALPPDTAHQSISGIDVTDRGLTSDIVLGDEPAVVFRGRAEGSRRVSVTFRVDRAARRTRLPAVRPAGDPPRQALDALRPATLFPSRSILVREFLETHVGPKLAEFDGDMVRAIYAVLRERIPHSSKGKSLPLDVLRRGIGLRIGRERVFTACLRSAGIPARFIEGIDPTSKTRRKRVFWNEVWANGQWYPVSLSRAWLGKFPDEVAALTSDGRQVVRSLGAGKTEYSVIAKSLPTKPRAADGDKGEESDDLP